MAIGLVLIACRVPCYALALLGLERRKITARKRFLRLTMRSKCCFRIGSDVENFGHTDNAVAWFGGYKPGQRPQTCGVVHFSISITQLHIIRERKSQLGWKCPPSFYQNESKQSAKQRRPRCSHLLVAITRTITKCGVAVILWAAFQVAASTADKIAPLLMFAAATLDSGGRWVHTWWTSGNRYLKRPLADQPLADRLGRRVQYRFPMVIVFTTNYSFLRGAPKYLH